MRTDDDREKVDEVDPLLDQVRPEPNPELIHQHDELEDPLDQAIEAEEQEIAYEEQVEDSEEIVSSTEPDEVLTA